MIRTILMLEHDEDDRYITQSVFDENNYNINLQFVTNSHDLTAFLEDCVSKRSQLPALILLNYHAHPLTAKEIIMKMRADTRFQHIPLVVLSGTVHPDVVKECYQEGANSFIKKPSSEKATTTKISNFIKYWFETVELM